MYGWQTDEIGQEWVESPSTSPTHDPPIISSRITSKSSSTNGKGSIADKRGSLRSLGYSAPRGLPSRQSSSSHPEDSSPARVVSGHGNGSRLYPSGEFIVPHGTGLISPPSSRSSSDADADIDGKAEEAAGTCVVKDGVEDNRGGALAKLGLKSNDIFGKNALERMFEPPSPPFVPLPTLDPIPAIPTTTTPSRPPPTTATPLSTAGSSNTSVDQIRRASHPFAPRNPSRLSKSMTPSSHSSNTSHQPDETSILDETLPAEDEPSTDVIQEQKEVEMSVSMSRISLKSGEIETDLSPLAKGATRFPFTFQAPIRSTSGETGGTGSGSATIRGGSLRSQAQIIPVTAERGDTDEFEALFNEPDNGEGPSHSTIHNNLPSMPAKRNKAGKHVAKSPKLPPSNPNLRLFRSTYDTYTREHLSAIVDSIGIEASPSPPPPGSSIADTPSPASRSEEDQGIQHEWSSTSASRSPGESDSRSSKRLRLSPPSPRRQPRDWGNVGLEIMGRIKGRKVEESTTSASPYASGGSLVDGDDGASLDYPTIPPTPPLNHRNLAPPIQTAKLPSFDMHIQSKSKPGPNGQHRSNPSTASSGYLRTAEQLMANLRQRAVSDTASALTADSSPGAEEGGRRGVLSETDDNAGSGETDGWKSEWEYARRGAGKGRKGSPRKLLKRLSDAEYHQPIREDQGRGSGKYGSVRSRPTTSTSSSVQIQPQGVNTEDLNRFVSATTAPTYSTTISTSFIKHPGPKQGKPIRTIRPEEMNGLGLIGSQNQIGKMRFDPIAQKWVRERQGLERVSEGSEQERSGMGGSEESVDVFAGMSSEGGSRGSGRGLERQEGQEEVEEGTDTDTEDDEGLDVANTTTIDAEGLLDTSESESESASQHLQQSGQGITSSPLPIPSSLPISPPHRPGIGHTNSAPAILTPLPSSQAPRPIRSALRNPNSADNLYGTPGLKKKASWMTDLTPFLDGGERSLTRSVSFSDGRKVGKIEGLDTGANNARSRSGGVTDPGAGAMAMGSTSSLSLSEQLRGLGEEVRQAKEKAAAGSGCASGSSGRKNDDNVIAVEAELSGKEGGDGNLFNKEGMSLLASARTRRIQEVLGDMEDLSLDNITPSKPSRYPEPVRLPPALVPTPNPNKAGPSFTPDPDSSTTSTLPIRSFRRSRSHRDAHAQAQATFLTECSFAVASDQLVKVITDVQPFEPYWETLREVDLAGKGLEGVGRLKEFLPALDEVNLNDNAISYLTGIPSGVRTLLAAGNRLSALTSVDHLRNLQVLDLSRNQLDSVSQLRCLKHLRDLQVDHNRITDLSSIMNMDSLLKLSARGNRVDKLELEGSNWGKMEHLDLAENGLGEIEGLERLEGIVSLNLDDNDLTSLNSFTPLLKLRTLKVSRNDLAILDLAQFPRVRTVYADENRLVGLHRSDQSRSRLEALSLRSQRTRGLRLIKMEMEGVKRLYISGNDLSPDLFSWPIYHLTYLEMAACRLSSWPKDMAKNMPGLEVLNVNYNFFENLEGLKGMKALRKVSVVGNRLEEEKVCLEGLDKLEEVDLRMNPNTLGYYLSLFIPPHSLPAPSRPSLARPNKTAILLGRAFGPNATLTSSTRTFFTQQETGTDWAEMDKAFRRNLPDSWYTKRLVYRGRMMRNLKGLRVLDGLEVGEGERKKAAELLIRAERV